LPAGFDFASDQHGLHLGSSPNTVWVAFFQSGQARQSAASSRRVLRLVAVFPIGFERDQVASPGSIRQQLQSSFYIIGITYKKSFLNPD
jgi:hypothetical protein